LLRDFIESLYFPDSPYQFEAIGDDILGIVYERFLGNVINLDKGHIVAEEKPEVRHAGGVYYTPKFVVDTIIRRVVGPKIKGKTPEEILDITILDPACGSGSFLISALQYLYQHCIECFENDPETAIIKASPKSKTKTKRIGFQDEKGAWHLTPDFKGQILSSCIYGVDIDGQAVEVTIMSLYLKLLQGEEPKYWQKDFLQSRLLPSLDNNIHCGNSLISQTDFDKYWENKFNDLFGGDEDIRFRINAFDWKSHTRGFGRIFEKKQGFDCIIGNPPYIRVQELNKWASEECEFYKKYYISAQKGNYDIYVIFIEKGLQLLAPNGLMGYICPHKFWQATYGKNIREVLVKGKHLNAIIDFTDQQVFKGATTYTAIHILTKTPQKDIDYAAIKNLYDGKLQCLAVDEGKQSNDISVFKVSCPCNDSPWTFVNSNADRLLNIIKKNNPSLAEITSKIAQGIVSGCDPVFYVSLENGNYFSGYTQKRYKFEKELLHPLLKGAVHMKRWLAEKTSLYVIFPYKFKNNRWSLIDPEELRVKYKTIFDYFYECQEILEAREKGRFKGDKFYQYSRPQNFGVMPVHKVLVPSIAVKAEYSLDLGGEYYFAGSGGGGGGGYAILPKIDIDIKYLCALLNSRLLDGYLKTITTKFHSGWYAYNKQYIEQLPIKLITTREEKIKEKQIVGRVDKILEIKSLIQNKKLSDREIDNYQRQLDSYEEQINELVCELYGVEKIPE
jgi:hypothetical protein